MSVCRNRLGNVHNQYQGFRKRVLCVCSAGMLRSPTAAWILSNHPFGYNTRAVGTSTEFALIPLDEAHIVWADEIICFEPAHEFYIKQMMNNFNPDLWIPIHLVNVPDEYEFRDPELIELLEIRFMELYKKELDMR